MTTSPELHQVPPGGGDPDHGRTPTVAHGVAQAWSLFTARSEAGGDRLAEEARPGVQIKNPVMFVVLVGTVVTLIEAIRYSGIFTGASRSGCSSPSSSPISPRRWRRGAARPRPTRCGACGPKPRPAGSCPTAARNGWPRPPCPRAIWSSAKPTTSSRPTARSPKASCRWTSRRSPGSRHR